MISVSYSSTSSNWKTISFPSTLYLSPILDVLLHRVPKKIHPEIRLGLQEALVNAAKHGNKLDPSKKVKVKFSYHRGEYSWIVSDEGKGFIQELSCPLDEIDFPPEEAENGRGLCLLHQIFDQVLWDSHGNKVKLCKHIHQAPKPSFSLLMFL